MAVGVTTYRGRTGLASMPQLMSAGAGLPMILGDDPTGGTGLTEETSSTGSSGLGSILSGQAAKRRAELEAIKLKNEQEAAAAAIQRQITGAQNQANYLRSQLGAGIPAVTLENISGQETAGQNYINTQYANLLADLTGRRDTGTRLTTQGYDALRNYLASNVPQAYATAAQAVPTSVQNALAGYMQGQGVDTGAAQAAVDIANTQGMGGATNYNQLLNVLRAQEASGQQSRMSEEQMARTLAGAQLEAIYGQGTAGLEQQKLAALNELATRISNARLQAQQLQTARDQALQDALAALYGTGYVAPTETTSGETETVVTRDRPSGLDKPPTPVVSAPIAQLAAKVANIKNEALATRVENFVEANPQATKAQIAKVFPSLAKNITAAPTGGSSGPMVAFE